MNEAQFSINESKYRWRKKNRQKVRQWKREYYDRHKDRINAKRREEYRNRVNAAPPPTVYQQNLQSKIF